MIAFFASGPRGLESVLAEELLSIGAQNLRERRGGVSFQGTMELGYRVCLWSRVASRILYPLATFAAGSADDLYKGIQSVDWSDHLAADGKLWIDASGRLPGVDNDHFAALKIKDAIVDQLRTPEGLRPAIERESPDIRLNAHLHKGRVRLSLELSGDSLHRRGYRGDGGPAPLKENLAAGLLHLAGWPEAHADGAVLVDPMCGSGTFLIEAAMMASNFAPGLMRETFPLAGWKKAEPALWQRLCDEAKAERRDAPEKPIVFGFDADPRAVGSTRRNLEAAGFQPWIEIQRGKIDELQPPREKGLVVVNPPYGQRLVAEENELRLLYSTLSRVLRERFGGWSAGILLPRETPVSSLALRYQRRSQVYNGGIECYWQTHLLGRGGKAAKPRQLGMADVTGQDTKDAGAEMFANRLRKRLKHLRKWAKREKLSCYRVYDRDLPDFAVAVDCYGKWVHVQEYAPPSTIDAERAEQRLEQVKDVVPEVLNVPPDCVYYKTRRRQKGTEQYEKLDTFGEFVEVEEGGHTFRVNLNDYLDTGLFLDHRLTRAMLQKLAKGKRFLNLFAYTGTATVYAAAGGARSSVSVDLSTTYLDWAKENFKLNGLDANHELIKADCVKWIKNHDQRYDLIFLDPPTFSNSKSMDDSFNVQDDHAALISDLLRLLEKDGTLVFSNNFRGFKMDRQLLGDSRLRFEDISAKTIPEDFKRNQKIHNVWLITKVQ
jgi:23S rRNA (guanine2445-N2)-methyltransferase / 23S rRNA (guanine2069-N7)-methyltransferase